MKTSDIIASLGVIILLIAFLLNLYKRISPESKAYASLNFVGAATCGFASYMISFYPFVVLEGIWAAFALVSFFKVPRGTSEKVE
jgi:cytochrome bd-type quinol oxidase subunit 2